jgi:hypothetical protein
VHQLRPSKGKLSPLIYGEWEQGPPVIATKNLYIVKSLDGKRYETLKRRVSYRPTPTDEIKVVSFEVGFREYEDRPERTDRIIITRKPLSAKK